MTIKDIARECGVSIATVSNVLNGRKKTTPDIVEGIMKYLEDRGYMVVLQNLRLYARWSDNIYEASP